MVSFKDIKPTQALILMGGLCAVLFVVDSQCYFAKDACLPDLGYVITAPGVTSDDIVLINGLEHGYIDKEWKEKLGDVYLVIFSKIISGSYRLLPILSSATLLILTYFFSFKITNHRLASVISVMVLEFSKTFMWYSDSVSYPTTWVVCFFLSLYPFKKYYIRPISFIISFILKAQALAFLPLTFIREKEWKNKIAYYAIAGVTIAVAVGLNWIRYGGQINWQNIYYPQIGLYLLSQDMWILALLLPITLTLFYLRKLKTEWSGFLLLSMGYCLLFQYILPIVSSYNAYGYRMLPFVVFFALAIGLVISKKELLVGNLQQSISNYKANRNRHKAEINPKGDAPTDTIL